MLEGGFEQKLLSAVDSIHAASVGDMTWSTALESVCDFIGARAADLNIFNAGTLDYRAFHPARVDPFVLRYIADYMNDVAHENPRIGTIYLPMSEGRIISDSDIWSPSELSRMPFFGGFLQPWGTFDSLNTWVRRTNDGTPWIALAVHFCKEKSPPQAEERQRLSMLLPHLRRACSVEERLGTAQQTTLVLQDALDQLNDAVMLLDAQGKLVHANLQAWKLLGEQQGILLTGNDVLYLSNSKSQDALLAALRRARMPESILDTHDTKPSAQIVIARAGLAPLILTVQPLPSTRGPRSGAAAMLFVQTPRATSSHELQALREVYGLTPAEIHVVCGLINGSSLKEVSAHLSISYETARVHLRRIFSKTNTNRQAALVSLLRSGTLRSIHPTK